MDIIIYVILSVLLVVAVVIIWWLWSNQNASEDIYYSTKRGKRAEDTTVKDVVQAVQKDLASALAPLENRLHEIEDRLSRMEGNSLKEPSKSQTIPDSIVPRTLTSAENPRQEVYRLLDSGLSPELIAHNLGIAQGEVLLLKNLRSSSTAVISPPVS
jgi:hypothetical protein